MILLTLSQLGEGERNASASLSPGATDTISNMSAFHQLSGINRNMTFLLYEVLFKVSR